MPTYSYRCNTCGHQFDQVQRFSEDPLTDCPDCEGSVRRVIQPVGVVFKGSGWYINDSRKSPESDAATAKPKEKDKTKPSETAKTATTDSGTSGKADTAKPKSAAPA